MPKDSLLSFEDGDDFVGSLAEAVREILALRSQVKRLSAENEFLRINPSFGTFTRQALELENRRLIGHRYLVMIDIDDLHALNARHGSQEPVNEMIRRAFNFRYDDLLLKANYASGDEVVFLVRTNPESFMARLSENLGREGISATMVFEPLSDTDDLLEVCDRAIHRVYEIKATKKGGRE